MNLLTSCWKNMEIQFPESSLDYLRTYIMQLHLDIKENLFSLYDPGNISNKPSLGYYISIYEKTHETRKVKSWEQFNSIKIKNFEISTIKMKVDDKSHQNLYVIYPLNKFEVKFYSELEKILEKIDYKYQKESTTICVQEFGYSMAFHRDSGVKSRIHINLNRNSLDYFYTDEGNYKVEYGVPYLFEASKVNHGFMSFQSEPRIHIILDVI